MRPSFGAGWRRLLAFRLWLQEKTGGSEVHATLFGAGFVGLLGGLSSILFRRAIEFFQLHLVGEGGNLVVAAAGLSWQMRLAIPVVGGVLAGCVLHYGLRLLNYKSSTDYMEAISLGNGVVRVRATLIKSLSSLFTIASGGAIGREGPMVQLSAMLASVTGRRFGLPVPRLRLLVACGAAAGIASTYNAPIAGALFVAEIVLGTIAMESFGPLVFASVIATVTVRELWNGAPAYAIPGYQLVSIWELAPYLLLGVATGLLGPVFLSILKTGERLFATLGGNIPLRMAVGGFIVGLLSLAAPAVWGNGYDVVSAILHREPLESALLPPSALWQGVFLLLVLKVVATAATAGSGAVGGIFTPTICVGAAIGYLFGYPVHLLWPATTASADAYALVGMGCFLAATTRAPIMAILMLFEMTLDYAIVLPLMLACVAAFYVAQGTGGESIYAEAMRRKKALAPDPRLATLRVGDLMKPNPPHIGERSHFGDAARFFVSNRFNYLYVTDGTNRFRGAISLHDMKPFLHDAEVAELALALDVMQEEFPLLTPAHTLSEAMEHFGRHDGERLPVVFAVDDPVLLGSLSKRDLLLAMADYAK
ncbi:chloride channel protein, CIC family [Verrucomicrobium sp. GAS474]|uniref:ClcB-like voltage-gated chloride channel protein n=1 Tax=Verrucomicrobium sp. GAS474 TaxID=1882831 RepID=UPI00087B5C58|nr:ClcB-like voltage-gated chloride channel protein [Verrucomicrobium sp. GAS474]SDU06169.1 chloride channel protein, CIC family [Verrucomicrobium sp. GAS474]